MLADPYASKVLNPVVHDRLVRNVEAYAHGARIQPHFIWTPLAENCGAEEIDYVKKFAFHRTSGIAGLMYVGDKLGKVDIETRMAAMAGALLRNFIDARLVTMAELFEEIEDAGSMPEISALFIPTFHHIVKGGGRASWKNINVFDVLTYRKSLGVQTIVYTPDLDALAVDYGVAVARMLRQNYVRIDL